MEGILAIIMTMAIPIVIAVCYTVKSILNKRSETELRKAIATSNIDAETAKVLVTQQLQQSKTRLSTTSLTGGLSLIGIGLGMILASLLGYSVNQLEFWIMLAFGTGFGLLVSFIIIWKMSSDLQKNKETEESDNP